MTKRSKLILGIIAVAIIIFSGALFGLAKYGVIHIKMLADVTTNSSAFSVLVKDSTGNVVGSGVDVTLKNANSNAEVASQITGADGIAKFTSIPDGNYRIYVAGGQNSIKVLNGTCASNVAATLPFSGNFVVIYCSGSSGGTCGGTTCAITQHCSSSNQCVDSCPAVRCKTGETCNATTQECQANNQVEHEVTLSVSVKTDCVDCRNLDSQGIVSNIPISFADYNGLSRNSNSPDQHILSFERIKTGSYTFKINDSKSDNYNSDYESKTETKTISSSNASASIQFQLKENPASVSNGKLDIYGLATEQDPTKVVTGVVVSTKVDCSDITDNSSKATCESHKAESEKQSTSLATLLTGKPANYSIDGIYDFTLLPVSSFPNISINLNLPNNINYYYDKNDNKKFDVGEDGIITNAATIERSNVMISGHSRTVRKNFDKFRKKIADTPVEEQRYYIIGGRVKTNSRVTGVDLPIGGINLKLSSSDSIATTISKDKVFSEPLIDKTENYFFNKFLGKEGEYTFSVDLPSDSPYRVIRYIGEPTFKLSDAENTGVKYQGKDVYYYGIHALLGLNPANTKKLIVYGNINGVLPSEISGISVQLDYANGSVTTTAKNDNLFEPEPLDTANYIIEALWAPNLAYDITTDNPNSLIIPESYQIFLSEDAVFNQDLNAYLYKKDFTVHSGNPKMIELNFHDAVSGKILQIDKDRISVTCVSTSDKILETCVKSISYDENSYKLKINFDYPMPTTFLTDHYVLKVGQSDNYKQFYDNIGLSSPQDIYLLPKKGFSRTDDLTCNTYNDYKFCTYKIIADQVFSPTRIEKLKKIAEIYKYFYPSRSHMVYIEAPGYDNPDALGYLRLEEIDSLSLAARHIVDRASADNIVNNQNSVYYNTFVRARLVARGYIDATHQILRTDGEPVRMCPEIFQNTTLFGRSEQDDAVAYRDFVVDYLLNHDTINNFFRDEQTRLNQPNNYHCLNALRSIDSLMNDQYSSVRVFSPSSVASTGGIGDSIESVNNDILAVMNEAGFKGSTKNSYDRVASTSNFNPTAAQIASGVWLKENYDKLSNTEKAGIQVKVLMNKISDATSSSKPIATIRETLSTLNIQMEKWLKAIGFKFTTASLRGIITDQTGVPVSGLNVIYGKKTDITDKLGSFTLNRVVSGTDQIVEVVDNHIGKTYTYTLRPTAKVTVNDDEQKGPLQFQIQRKELWVRGQIMQGDTPLSGGKVFIDGSPAIAISEDGRFGIKLKEGQYSFTFYNKNNKKLTVTNPGSYEDLPAVKVKAPAAGNVAENSMIWVK